MATNNKNKKNNRDGTDTKVLRIFSDAAFIAVMLTCAFTLMMFALTIAQKITITVGK